MKKTMTIQQAIFHLSVLNKQARKLENKMRSFRGVPLSIDNEGVVTQRQEQVVTETVAALLLVIDDIITLKNALDAANYEFGLQKLLTEVQTKRDLLVSLQQIVTEPSYDVVAQVGLVETGTINNSDFEKRITELSNEVNELSVLIDSKNSEYTLEVDLHY